MRHASCVMQLPCDHGAEHTAGVCLVACIDTHSAHKHSLNTPTHTVGSCRLQTTAFWLYIQSFVSLWFNCRNGRCLVFSYSSFSKCKYQIRQHIFGFLSLNLILIIDAWINDLSLTNVCLMEFTMRLEQNFPWFLKWP